MSTKTTTVVTQLTNTLRNLHNAGCVSPMNDRSNDYALRSLAGAVPNALHYRQRYLQPRIDELVAELKDMQDQFLTDGTQSTPKTAVPEILEMQVTRKLDYLADLQGQLDHTEVLMNIAKEVFKELVGEDWKAPAASRVAGNASTVAHRLASALNRK